MDLNWLKSVYSYLGKTPGQAAALTSLPKLDIHSDPEDELKCELEETISMKDAVASLPSYSPVKRRFSSGKKFRPMADYRSFVSRVDTAWKEPTDKEVLGTREKCFQRVSPVLLDKAQEEDVRAPEEVPVLKFPYVDGGEIAKHEKLNIDAEKLGRLKSPCPYEDYLEIVRRQCEAQKPKKPKEQLTKEEKIPTPKPPPKPPRWLWDVSDDSASDKAAPIETTSSTLKKERISRVVLDFKYSYAVEQYYRQQLRRKKNNLRKSVSNLNYGERTEVKYGFMVTTLGANVLNLRARTLPSCNPLELRMRKQLERGNATLSKKTVDASSDNLTFSRSSVL